MKTEIFWTLKKIETFIDYKALTVKKVAYDLTKIRKMLQVNVIGIG